VNIQNGIIEIKDTSRDEYVFYRPVCSLLEIVTMKE